MVAGLLRSPSGHDDFYVTVREFEMVMRSLPSFVVRAPCEPVAIQEFALVADIDVLQRFALASGLHSCKAEMANRDYGFFRRQHGFLLKKTFLPPSPSWAEEDRKNGETLLIVKNRANGFCWRDSWRRKRGRRRSRRGLGGAGGRNL